MRKLTPEMLAEQRKRYAEDDYERTIRMWVEIGCGVPREESTACSTAEDEATWDSMVAENAMMDEKGWIGGAGIPLSEDHWEVDPETGQTDWVPVSLTAPPLPGFPGPVRYAEFPKDSDEDAKRVEATPVEEPPILPSPVEEPTGEPRPSPWAYKGPPRPERFGQDWAQPGAVTIITAQCMGCRHLLDIGICTAYPDGIPLAILINTHDHREPYPGDGGIRFEPI